MDRFVGTWTLTRFALRRDRILLPVWILVFSLMTVFSASATMALYPDEASRVTAASAVNDVPVAVAMYGRIWDPTSLGALSLLKMAAMGGVLIGVLAIMLVTRHARAEEEKGRTELIGATVVGAWAGLSAAVIVADDRHDGHRRAVGGRPHRRRPAGRRLVGLRPVVGGHGTRLRRDRGHHEPAELVGARRERAGHDRARRDLPAARRR